MFSEKPIIGAKQNNMSLRNINNMLDVDRSATQATKSRKVSIISVENKNNKKVFDSIVHCVAYLNSIAPSNKTTLYRRISSGTPYQRFICQWESEKLEPLTNKSVRVNITHVPSGTTKTYDSFRKAALSFLPKYATRGSTIKSLSHSNRLFKKWI